MMSFMKPLIFIGEDRMKIKIPKHWTPEQANAVVEFLSEIEIAIRKKYQIRILEHQLSELHREEIVDIERRQWESDNF